MSVKINNHIIRTLFLLITLLPSCSPKDAVPGAEKKVSKVNAVQVEMRHLDNDLSSFGSITYNTKNDITVQVGGVINALPVKEGDTVLRGQLIARLRNVQLEIQKEQYENTLNSAQAALSMALTKMQEARLGVESRLLSLEKNRLNLAQQELELAEARTTLEGRKELHQIGGVTDAALASMQLSVSAKEVEIAILKKDIEIAQLGLRDSDLAGAGFAVPQNAEEKKRLFIEFNTRQIAAEIEAARANVRNAEKSLDSANRLLDELIIRDSVSGVVGALYYENGEFITQNEKIATIMDITSVYGVFFIQEQDIINFTQGTPMKIEIPSLKHTITAAIDKISPVADPQSGNFSIKANIPNGNLLIKPGMFIKCNIPRKHDVFYPVIPETAVIRANGNEGAVFCIVNGIAVVKPIQIQSQKDGFLWISSGISEKETVIDKPSPFLKEGEYVEYL